MFVALIGLVLIIMAMHRLTGNKKDDRKKISVEKADTVSEQKAELADSAVQQISMDEDSEELVAVITAAIAASLHRSTHDLVVRSIRRIPAITPVWNRTSRQEQVSARL